MRTLQWDRNRRIAEIRDRIWLYLTPSAVRETLALEAAALLQLPEADVLQLARVHFVLHEKVRRLIDALPGLMRRLATSSAYAEERSTERVRGAIRWPATLAARNASQFPNLYITSPAERAYQTPENELLVFVLDAIVTIGGQTGWDAERGPELARGVNFVVGESRRLLGNRMLLQVERRAPTPRSVSRVRGGRAWRRYEPVVAVYELYENLISELNRSSIRQLIERTGLLTRSDATLFELLCTFQVIDSLRELGWDTQPLRLFEGSLQLAAHRGEEQLRLWYQTAPRQLHRDSRYTSVLFQHGFQRPQDLRPDLVLLRTTGEKRWLIIEEKMGERRDVTNSARAALADLLGYREAFRTALAANAHPYGLGIAWGADLTPTVGSDVMLCTPDQITEALTLAFG
jgi:hypothetical protein